MIGLHVECETCGKSSRIEATTSLTAEKTGHDLSCGHRNGWTPDVPFPERLPDGSRVPITPEDNPSNELFEPAETE